MPNGIYVVTVETMQSASVTFSKPCGYAPPELTPVGVVESVNALTVLGPWFAVIVLVGCIGTVVVVAKKRRP